MLQTYHYCVVSHCCQFAVLYESAHNEEMLRKCSAVATPPPPCWLLRQHRPRLEGGSIYLLVDFRFCLHLLLPPLEKIFNQNSFLKIIFLLKSTRGWIINLKLSFKDRWMSNKNMLYIIRTRLPYIPHTCVPTFPSVFLNFIVGEASGFAIHVF